MNRLLQNQQNLRNRDFIKIEISSHRDSKARQIDKILANPVEGDILLVAELSMLCRNMIEVIDIVNNLEENGVEVIFAGPSDLSTGRATYHLPAYHYFVRRDPELLQIRGGPPTASR